MEAIFQKYGEIDHVQIDARIVYKSSDAAERATNEQDDVFEKINGLENSGKITIIWYFVQIFYLNSNRYLHWFLIIPKNQANLII